MTTTTRNEAAERLRLDHTTDCQWADACICGQAQALDQALIAERRATVERIRERLMESDAGHESGWVWPILDEEAAR